MFNLFKKNKTSVNSLKFTSFGWEQSAKENGFIQWVNPEHTMALSINYFDSIPDLPHASSIDAVREFYRTQLAQSNGGLITVDFIQLGKFQAIKTIFKIAQEPTGVQYLASITIPFNVCSYVIKIQAPEIGVTGVRESVILDNLLGKPEYAGKEISEFWTADPYASNFKEGCLMNLSELEKHDERFPEHPLSAARKLINEIERSILLEEELLKLDSFYML